MCRQFQMSERTYPLLYIFQLSSKIRNEYRKTHFWVTWSTHDQDHELLIYDTNLEFSIMHPTWMLSRWAAMTVKTGTRSFEWACINKSFMMLSKGLSLIWNTFNWTQGCLIRLNTIFSVNAEGAQQKECHKVSAIWWCQFTSELQFFVIFCHCCRWS